ncbi:MAG: hypothetical protein Tsb0020_32740 [Haliangiales bacterium]
MLTRGVSSTSGPSDASVAPDLRDPSQPAPKTPAVNESFELGNAFTSEFVSAFSEIYNNIPIHAYQRGQSGAGGAIELSATIGSDHLIVDLIDTGKSFDIKAVPLPEHLPTGGMGIHIARSMLDDLDYRPGPPNHWRLVKYLASQTGSSEPPIASSQPAK